MNLLFMGAAFLAAAICVIHLILGGREIARRHLAAESLHPVVKYTMYYCWHLVTITLAGMALAFLLAAQPGGTRELAVFATAGAGLFALLCLGIIARMQLKAWQHPQWALFLPLAALGAAGLWW